MPSRNIVKCYDVCAYYHVYNRGVEKRKIFFDDEDYSVFLNLFKRYLSDSPIKDNKGREYDWLSADVEIIAFCLMPNHFHLLLYQINIDSITKLLRSVCSAYTIYFNKKYDRVGSLFQGVFKASNIYENSYLEYITRYIHRNPIDYMNWNWSSLGYWLKNEYAEWLKPDRLNNSTAEKYLEFINDDKNYKSSIDNIKRYIYKM